MFPATLSGKSLVRSVSGASLLGCEVVGPHSGGLTTATKGVDGPVDPICDAKLRAPKSCHSIAAARACHCRRLDENRGAPRPFEANHEATSCDWASGGPGLLLTGFERVRSSARSVLARSRSFG